MEDNRNKANYDNGNWEGRSTSSYGGSKNQAEARDDKSKSNSCSKCSYFDESKHDSSDKCRATEESAE